MVCVTVYNNCVCVCGVCLSCGVCILYGVCLGPEVYDCVCALCHVHAHCVYTYMSVCMFVSCVGA